MDNHILKKIIFEEEPRSEVPPPHIYEVKCNGFTTIVDVDKSPTVDNIPPVLPVNAILYSPNRETLATLNAIRIAKDSANIYHTSVSKDASLRDKWAYFAEIYVAFEKAMLREGIKELTISTHTTVAKLLKDMGWAEVGTRGTRIDLEKKLSKENIHIPLILEKYQTHF